jgi:hypothetical protein
MLEGARLQSLKRQAQNRAAATVDSVGEEEVVRRSMLELWKRASEMGVEIGAILPSSGISAVDAWNEEFHA